MTMAWTIALSIYAIPGTVFALLFLMPGMDWTPEVDRRLRDSPVATSIALFVLLCTMVVAWPWFIYAIVREERR